jgi:hypothetical protein
VLDGGVGAVSVVFGFTAAWWLHSNRRARGPGDRAGGSGGVALAVGYGLAVDFADALSSTRVSLSDPSLASGRVPS